MAVSYLTKVGLAKETSWGSSTTPTALLPIDPPTFTVNYEQILDQSLRGLAVLDYAAYQGVGQVEASMEGNFYPEELGMLLFSAMGSCASVGTGSLYQHEFTVGAHPPSLSIQDENDIMTYRYTGCMVSELTLTFNSAEGLLRWSSSLVGKQMVEDPAGAIPEEDTSAPFRSWQMCAAIGAADPLGKILEGEITLSREINLHFTDCGSQYAGTAFAGPLEVTGRATIFFDAHSDYQRYLDKTQEAFSLTWDYGSGADQRTLVFTANNMDFGDSPAEIDRSDASITLAYTMRGLYHADDAGNCKWTLLNSKESY
jgi:hypothetical protein